jgi:ABC-2 type transport system permease protein
MIALVSSGMAKYAAYQGNGQSMNALISQFPIAIQTIFGISGFDLSKASGFYGVLFIYIALMATIHAVLLGTDIISKEERDKTSEFLFVKPISRIKVITVKICAGLSNLIILNIVTLVSSLYFVNYFSKSSLADNDIMILIVGILFMQFLFFFIGTAIAAVIMKPKNSSSVATSVLLFTFILAFIININKNLENLKYFSPFKYFDAKTIMAAGKLDATYVFMSLAIIIAMIVVTYLGFSSKDLND